MTAHDILKSLNYRYPRQNVKYKIANSYVFRWESDFLFITKSGYCCEVEIKISRGDFFRDEGKKQKHEILKSGKYSYARRLHNPLSGKFDREVIEEKKCDLRPHKFYYCTPKGLIGVADLPTHAGLMYWNELGGVEIVKEAPYLHKGKLELHPVLCDKYYNKWMDTKHQLERIKAEKRIEAQYKP